MCVLSMIDLEAQMTANAATWLDRDLIADVPAATRNGGFGREVRDALARRRQWLIEQGLARWEGDKTIYPRSVLSTLARRELQQAGEDLARERGLSFYTPASGERITGTYRQSVQLVSGKYALVEKSRQFTLVPWRPVIEKELGHSVSGFVQEFGRKRGAWHRHVRATHQRRGGRSGSLRRAHPLCTSASFRRSARRARSTSNSGMAHCTGIVAKCHSTKSLPR
jgi:hypothetical protein